MEGIRIGEEAVLKTVGCKSLGGSSPSPSAVEFVRGYGLIRYFQTSRVKTQNTDPLVFGLNVEKKRKHNQEV
jgi:hypothetical protein